jgi:transposase-like protein
MEKGEIKKVVRRFARKDILSAVRLVEEGSARRDVLSQFGCSETTLGEWLRVYGSASYHQNKRKTYSKTEKRAVVQAFTNGMSLKEVSIAYGITSVKLIRDWVRQSEEEKFDLYVSEEVMAKKKKEQEPEDVAALRQELELAKLKIEALNTLIDVAEDHLKIDIRKKSGAGRSSK